jgi:hypothetical protein
MDNALVYATWVMALASCAMAIASIVSARDARKAINEQQKNFDRQIKEQQENFDRQIAEYRLALYAETTLRFEKRFNGPRFTQIRSKAARALLNKQDEVEAEDVFDFFETLGLFVKRGALDEGIAYSVFFHWINLYWRAGKHHIGSKQKDATTLWGDFSFLYERVCDIEKRNDPDSEDLRMPDSRLRQELQEEIDLYQEP